MMKRTIHRFVGVVLMLAGVSAGTHAARGSPPPHGDRAHADHHRVPLMAGVPVRILMDSSGGGSLQVYVQDVSHTGFSEGGLTEVEAWTPMRTGQYTFVVVGDARYTLAVCQAICASFEGNLGLSSAAGRGGHW